jgi:glycosyltransferase involved in cell wall biosynthesis
MGIRAIDGTGVSAEVNAPSVSVCMITYQHAPFIRQALDSVLMQQVDFPIEICIGEDGSSDGTRDICQEYAAKHPDKIRLFLRDRANPARQQYRVPYAHNFIETLKACRGKYIAPLEGDDYWTDPLKLKTQVSFLEDHTDFVMSAHSTMVVYQDGSHPDAEFCNLDEEIYSVEDVIGRRLFATNSIVYKRSVLADLPDWLGMIVSIDRAILILVSSCGKIRYHNTCMGVYRKHSGGISSYGNLEMIFRSNLWFWGKVKEYFGHRYDNLVNEVIAETYAEMVDYHLAKNDRMKSARYLFAYALRRLQSGTFRVTDILRKAYCVAVPRSHRVAIGLARRKLRFSRKSPQLLRDQP